MVEISQGGPNSQVKRLTALGGGIMLASSRRFMCWSSAGRRSCFCSGGYGTSLRHRLGGKIIDEHSQH
jgi:hypothetical protein